MEEKRKKAVEGSKMELEYLNINELKEYKGNAKRHPKKQIKQIIKSIEDYGYNDPIAVDENNMILEGHGRLKALKELGYTEVPVIRLKGLSEDDKKAYILVHNKINLNTGFDDEKLFGELDSLNVDLSDFGFNMDKAFDNLFKENQRVKTNNHYNLNLVDIENSTNDFWQMPIIQNDGFIPDDLIGFNYAKSSEQKNVGIHFYIDDYQFERLWNTPQEYVDVLKQYDCMLSPDFSLYMDMPMAMKIWNVYRSRQIGQFYQKQGIKVIPTISWAEKETFSFAFKGIPKGSIVSISTIGVKKNKKALKIWNDGVKAMIEEIEPSTILVYGGKLDFDYGDIDVRYYENKVTEKMKEM